MSIEDSVLDAMKKSEKALKSGEVAQIVGADTKEVSKVITKLKKDGKVESPKRCYYSVVK